MRFHLLHATELSALGMAAWKLRRWEAGTYRYMLSPGLYLGNDICVVKLPIGLALWSKPNDNA